MMTLDCKEPYHEQFKKGERVTIASLADLAEFRRSWRWHHPLSADQLEFANRSAVVQDVGFYHGGDVLYWLEGIEGTWHERCLRPPNFDTDSHNGIPRGAAAADALQADRLTGLVHRIRRGRAFRCGGVAVFVGLVVFSALGIAFALGDWPAWLTIVAVPSVLVFGGIGEAVGRSIEERGASEAEVSFARALIWDSESDGPHQTWVGSRAIRNSRWVGSRDWRCTLPTKRSSAFLKG